MTPISWRLLPIFVLLLASCDGPRATASSRGGGGTLFLDEASGKVISRPGITPRFGTPLERARSHDLVDVRAFIPGISIDLRYTTAENVTGRPLYPRHMPCLLRRETAMKLKEAHELLRAQGYGIRVWDAYRPPEAQEKLHAAGASTHMFLSPETMGWSRHCGGIAVDVTLVDGNQQEQRMPTGFDAGLRNASARYQGGDSVVARNLQLLQRAMLRAGFAQVRAEWWHFDDGDFVDNPQPVIFGHQLAIPVL
ncbi:MAG: M15 family metallopeptidase [Verrucomicrobiaceae bacterium]|nr:M15 family metallopeptidase [Verrucomicrobiaceae bacterium]